MSHRSHLPHRERSDGQSGVVFATGCGRSGTTALRTALSAHPDLISTGTENNIVGDLLLSCELNATVESRRVSMQVDEATHNGLFGQLILDLHFPEGDRSGDGRRLLLATWLTPVSAPRAKGVFPGSKFVLIVRDGVATIESRLAHHTLGQGTFEDQCEKWAQWGELFAWACDRADWIIVRHERLLADPVGTIGSVIEFLGLPNDPGPASVLERKRFHPTPDSLRPSWQGWSDADRAAFERICAPSMEMLGYSIPWRVERVMSW